MACAMRSSATLASSSFRWSLYWTAVLRWLSRRHRAAHCCCCAAVTLRAPPSVPLSAGTSADACVAAKASSKALSSATDVAAPAANASHAAATCRATPRSVSGSMGRLAGLAVSWRASSGSAAHARLEGSPWPAACTFKVIHLECLPWRHRVHSYRNIGCFHGILSLALTLALYAGASSGCAVAGDSPAAGCITMTRAALPTRSRHAATSWTM